MNQLQNTTCYLRSKTICSHRIGRNIWYQRISKAHEYFAENPDKRCLDKKYLFDNATTTFKHSNGTIDAYSQNEILIDYLNI